jgi:hypothetical protein
MFHFDRYVLDQLTDICLLRLNQEGKYVRIAFPSRATRGTQITYMYMSEVSGGVIASHETSCRPRASCFFPGSRMLSEFSCQKCNTTVAAPSCLVNIQNNLCSWFTYECLLVNIRVSLGSSCQKCNTTVAVPSCLVNIQNNLCWYWGFCGVILK